MDDVTFWKQYDEWLEFFLAYPKHEPDTPNFREFPEVYPAGKSIVNTKLKEYKSELKRIHDKEKEIKAWTVAHCHNYTQLELLTEINLALGIGERKDIVEGHIKRLERLKIIYSNKPTSKKFIDKESVKDIPISDYLDFNRAKKCPCIWHNDKNPSLQYYPQTNTVYCWSCGASGDIIDVIQQLHGCDFKQALKILNNES
jgi:hypothetical protein